jgi:hypothetical protein
MTSRLLRRQTSADGIADVWRLADSQRGAELAQFLLQRVR